MGSGRRYFARNLIQAGAGSFEAEYQAVLDRASFLGYATPDSTTNTRNNLRVKYLKDIGAWGYFDLFYVFDNPTGLTDFSKLNYADPSNFELSNPTPSLEPDFIADSGFKGDGSKWFDTNYNLSTDKTNLTDGATANSVIGYKGFDFTANSTTELICGSYISSNNKNIQIAKLSTNTSTLERVLDNQGAVVNFTALEHNSHLYYSKTRLTAVTVRDGINTEISRPMQNDTFINQTLYLFSQNNAGTANGFSLSGLSYFFIGGNILIDSLSEVEIADLVYQIMTDTY